MDAGFERNRGIISILSDKMAAVSPYCKNGNLKKRGSSPPQAHLRPVLQPTPGGMGAGEGLPCPGVKLEAQGLHDLQNRCQLGIAVAGEGLVQALSSTAFLAFSKAVEGCLTGQIFIVE